MEKVKAFIVNRNLLTTLTNTVEFLKKESRVDIIIFDQQSTYPPLLDYYKNSGVSVVFSNDNDGPYNVWKGQLNPYFNDSPYIVTDSDCLYDTVPDDWFDKMLEALNNNPVLKVGFSLEINDLPDTYMGNSARGWETGYWHSKNQYGWQSPIDTTFALYKPHSSHDINPAIRLDRPYCIKHVPWYLTKENITEEWLYYLEHASSASSWGSKLKRLIENEQ